MKENPRGEGRERGRTGQTSASSVALRPVFLYLAFLLMLHPFPLLPNTASPHNSSGRRGFEAESSRIAGVESPGERTGAARKTVYVARRAADRKEKPCVPAFSGERTGVSEEEEEKERKNSAPLPVKSSRTKECATDSLDTPHATARAVRRVLAVVELRRGGGSRGGRGKLVLFR